MFANLEVKDLFPTPIWVADMDPAKSAKLNEKLSAEIYRLTDSGGVEASPLPSKIQLASGDDFEISVKAFSGATRLLGELDATWRLDQDIVTILDTGRPASRRLRVKTPGTTKLRIA